VEKHYSPQSVEQKIYEEWEKNGYFKADCKSNKTAYSIVIPPPNVTGILHMGHALNNSIQDILTRYKRMDGYEALWVPGTDHAGIATQNVVEKKLSQEGGSRHKLGREKFVEKVWEWKERYHATIVKQLRKLGCSCDWSRERFTMDDGLSKAVRKVFVKLYEDGLVYRGKYIVNWCPRCRTALADDEVEHQDDEGTLWYFRYPFADKSGYMVVATTRPETMLGDCAVAVNPKDERYKDFVGKTLLLPIMNREIPLICDDYVSKDFGTGAVKITPAHDPNDFQMGLRHDLQPIAVMDESAKMSGEIPAEYVGLDRFEARRKIVEKFEELGLLEKIEKHDHAVGHCYRCDTIIEPRYCDQWFVKMKPLAQKSLEVVLENRIKFHPARWKKTYINWMENIRDWCISRQIWWGHRIPVWYCEDCGEIIVSEVDAQECPKCNSRKLQQDSDVLDTWFSSWLWPFTTMGWDGEMKSDDLKKFFPTDVLSTAPEILFFWVARMVMASLYFTKEIPFSDVILHGTVRDKTGKKMSKSLGNTIDPLEIIDAHGADSLRFSMIMNTAEGTDIFIGKDSFDIGRNFANKLWNASRFLISNIENPISFEDLPSKSELKTEDNWIISQLNRTIENVRRTLDQYKFNEACHFLYDFIWKDFCDWYIEAKKSDFYNPKTPKNKENALYCASYALVISLKLLHPFMPFVTEEIWRHLKKKVKTPFIDNDSIMLSSFPKPDNSRILEDVADDFAFLQEIITGLRTIRSENNVPPEKKVEVIIIPSDEKAQKTLQSLDYLIKLFVKSDSLTISQSAQKPTLAGQSVINKSEIYVVLEGLADVDAEKEKIVKEIARLQNAAKGFESRLNNKEFTDKAPQNVVENEKVKYRNVLETLEKLKTNLAALG
jgi:valyl-tRNA synthetase